MTGLALTLDHVPFAWSDLDAARAEFDRLGLETEYGGIHDNGVTHMALVGFDDRSYVELISERQPGDHEFWPDRIRGDAGPAHWAVRVVDIDGACGRLRDAGVPVSGPVYGSREPADGELIEWDGALLGREDDHVLPFLIADRTPLASRVSPSPGVTGGPLTGVGQVVIGVRSLEEAIETFQSVFGVPEPVSEPVDPFGTVASFPGEPVALATPRCENWLADRLDRFPQGPCACLLATDNLERACERHPLDEARHWPDGRLASFATERFGPMLGVVERPAA